MIFLRQTLLIILLPFVVLADQDNPVYTSESPLPAGWKTPTPDQYHLIIKKKLPAYRGAFTYGSKSFLMFPRLFKHIKKQNIPMSSPVEISIVDDPNSNKKLSMAFLYQNKSVSNASDKKNIEIKDIPSESVISYMWQGCDCEKNQEAAKGYLYDYASKNGLSLRDFRLFGYNSPSIEDDNQTWEMVAKFK